MVRLITPRFSETAIKAGLPEPLAPRIPDLGWMLGDGWYQCHKPSQLLLHKWEIDLINEMINTKYLQNRRRNGEINTS